jgi:hypothetical protein
VTIKRPSWLSILHETGKRICLLFLEFLYANCQGRKTKLEEEEIRQNPNKMAGRTSMKKAVKWEKKKKKIIKSDRINLNFFAPIFRQ